VSVTNIHIPPILAESTPGGFTRAARLLPDGIDWKGGVTFSGSCGGAERAGCDYGVDVWTVEDKADPVEFDPFLIGASLKCSGAPDMEELVTLVDNRMVRGTSGQFARELHTSQVGNPDLVNNATDITPVTPPCVDKAIAGLLSTADDCGGGVLTIHIPLVALASLMTFDLVEFRDGRYRLGGHNIIVDAYPNTPPSGGAAAGADQAWIWATGPVEYAVGESLRVEHFQDRLNESVVVAERMSILRFDPCCAYAILADIC
jgi:hypothetical protein